MKDTTFCGLPARPDPFVRNAWTMTGPMYIAFREFRQDLGRYDFQSCSPEAVWIDPEHIEGILLSQDDIQDPGRFWSQHKPAGTLDSFLRIAGHIGETARLLDSDEKSLDSLMRDERLGPCASIYFDLRRPDSLQLYQGDGFYWFQSNGRHRVLAARIAGVRIPALVTGRIIKKGGC